MQRTAWIVLTVPLVVFSRATPAFAQLEPVVEEVCATLGCEDFCPVCPPGVPAGTIVMWSGSLDSIPADWALCDGTNGTPDLRDRFVMGAADGEEPGGTGGSNDHGHTSPAHSHSTSTNVHSHSVSGSGTTSPSGVHSHFSTPPNSQATAGSGSTAVASAGHTHVSTQDGAHAHGYSFGVTSSPAGSSAPTESVGTTTDVGDHVPPFYTLAFIMKLP